MFIEDYRRHDNLYDFIPSIFLAFYVCYTFLKHSLGFNDMALKYVNSLIVVKLYMVKVYIFYK